MADKKLRISLDEFEQYAITELNNRFLDSHVEIVGYFSKKGREFEREELPEMVEILINDND